MSDLSYPRKWFRVSNYGGSIVGREFIRETDKMLFYTDWRGREAREAKSTSYAHWHPTREEAKAASAAIKQRNDERERARRIHEAAPDLLEAAEHMLVAHESESETHYAAAIAKLTAAISKALNTGDTHDRGDGQ